MKHFLCGTILAAGITAFAVPVAAAPLIGDLGGASGFGALVATWDEESWSPTVGSNLIDLPFAMSMGGATYTEAWLNTGGSLSFSMAQDFTLPPFPGFPEVPGPVLAPLSFSSWAIETNVYLASPSADTMVATWISGSADDGNAFQLILKDRADTGAGNFDFSFRYDYMNWPQIEHDVSTPQAGYDLGNGVFTADGDVVHTADFRNLSGYSSDWDTFLGFPDVLTTSGNVSADHPGLWSFAVRDGAIADGSTATTPLLPYLAVEDGWIFEFNVTPELRPVFVDPEIAIGYDYVVNAGPNITAAWFADVGNPSDYTLLGWDGADYTISLGTVGAEDWFSFGSDGVDRFAVRGIDAALGLDPENPLAFVTGLQFAGFGPVTVTMSPVTIDDGDGGPVVPGIPEPTSWALLIAGFGMVGATMRRRRQLAA